MLQATPVVFVVDDDISVRKSLESLIDSAGWQPETFPSAQAFLHRPRVVGPSCLVLDVSLPDLDGLELQKRVASDRQHAFLPPARIVPCVGSASARPTLSRVTTALRRRATPAGRSDAVQLQPGRVPKPFKVP